MLALLLCVLVSFWSERSMIVSGICMGHVHLSAIFVGSSVYGSFPYQFSPYLREYCIVDVIDSVFWLVVQVLTNHNAAIEPRPEMERFESFPVSVSKDSRLQCRVVYSEQQKNSLCPQLAEMDCRLISGKRLLFTLQPLCHIKVLHDERRRIRCRVP